MGKRFWLPVLTLWWRELIRFWRERTRVLGFVGSPLIFWLVIGSGFGDLAFFFPGALTLTVMFSAIFSTMSLIEDRREGFLLSMLVSPAPRSAMVLGKVLGSSTLAWLQGLIVLMFLPVAGLWPGTLALLQVIGVLYVISFTFTALGFLIAWRMESTQAFHAIINLVAGPPLDGLGRTVQHLHRARMDAMADAHQSIDLLSCGAAGAACTTGAARNTGHCSVHPNYRLLRYPAVGCGYTGSSGKDDPELCLSDA